MLTYADVSIRQHTSTKEGQRRDSSSQISSSIAIYTENYIYMDIYTEVYRERFRDTDKETIGTVHTEI
jgi:hypothetical protein